MRATPPAARMSAGTRSRAITATAPASSAIFACSGVTTSMMTPPLSIWARPFLVAQVDVSTVMLVWFPGVSAGFRERPAAGSCPHGSRRRPRALLLDYSEGVCGSRPRVRGGRAPCRTAPARRRPDATMATCPSTATGAQPPASAALPRPTLRRGRPDRARARIPSRPPRIALPRPRIAPSPLPRSPRPPIARPPLPRWPRRSRPAAPARASSRGAEAAAAPPRRFAGQPYWARPVPGFGDPAARILLLGLAPAAHGGNRTGRVFTGDRSGRLPVRSAPSRRARHASDERRR